MTHFDATTDSTSDWKPNIIVAVWGHSKATLLDRNACPREQAECTGNQTKRGYATDATFRGDCDNCRYFRGIDTQGINTAVWGQHFDGCCARLLEPESTKP